MRQGDPERSPLMLSKFFEKGDVMTKTQNYRKTLLACYLGFITQAISANFAPLLFLTFKETSDAKD